MDAEMIALIHDVVGFMRKYCGRFVRADGELQPRFVAEPWVNLHYINDTVDRADIAFAVSIAFDAFAWFDNDAATMQNWEWYERKYEYASQLIH